MADQKKITIKIGLRDPDRGNKRDITVEPTYAHVSANEKLRWVVRPLEAADADVTITFASNPNPFSPPSVNVAHKASNGETTESDDVTVSPATEKRHHARLKITMGAEDVVDDPNCPTIYIE